MTKIKAVFIKKIGENFEVIKTQKLKVDKKNIDVTHEEMKTKTLDVKDEKISLDGKTFLIPQAIHSLKRGRTIEIFFDFENETMLFFKEVKMPFDAKFLDKILSKNIIAQLVGKLRLSMETTDKSDFLKKLVVPVLCLVVGFFIGSSGII